MESKPPKIHSDHPNQSYVDSYPLDPLESSDHFRVRAALDKMDPETLLNQISQPKRPRWQSIIGDWFPVRVPRHIFDKWKVRHEERDHLYYEYNYATEDMIIRCMPSAAHEAVPDCFKGQATIMATKLNPAARHLVEVGSNRGMSSLLMSTNLLMSTKVLEA
jgi:hypothetical protein